MNFAFDNPDHALEALAEILDSVKPALRVREAQLVDDHGGVGLAAGERVGQLVVTPGGGARDLGATGSEVREDHQRQRPQ